MADLAHIRHLIYEARWSTARAAATRDPLALAYVRASAAQHTPEPDVDAALLDPNDEAAWAFAPHTTRARWSAMDPGGDGFGQDTSPWRDGDGDGAPSDPRDPSSGDARCGDGLRPGSGAGFWATASGDGGFAASGWMA